MKANYSLLHAVEVVTRLQAIIADVRKISEQVTELLDYDRQSNALSQNTKNELHLLRQQAQHSSAILSENIAAWDTRGIVVSKDWYASVRHTKTGGAA